MLDLRELAPETARPIRRVEYDKLVELGLFEDERVELLEGIIVQMSPQGAPHASTIDRLNELFVLALHGRARVRVQGSFAASDISEPEPDVSVLPLGDYDREHPQHALLLVEVAESSLKKDRGVKAKLYGRVGVPEYWIVNLPDRVVEVLTDPNEQGYAQHRVHRPGERITLARFADVSIAVDDVLPR